MTPEGWERCESPEKMLALLRRKASARKGRLLVCALARSVWDLLADERSRRAVEVAEAFADRQEGHEALRLASARARDALDEFAAAFLAARRATPGKYRKHVKEAEARANAAATAAWASSDDPLGFLESPSVGGVAELPEDDPLGCYDADSAVDSLLRKHPGLIRELHGNPFSPVRPDQARLASEDGAVARLALSIYTARRFEDLRILADLLEEAGLIDAGLLAHLRGPGPHCLGCHALDAVLGKA